jgi:hypothetical protein
MKTFTLLPAALGEFEITQLSPLGLDLPTQSLNLCLPLLAQELYNERLRRDLI